MPILHFSGKFKFQSPFYNNNPWNPEKYFDDAIKPKDVKKITSGAEPLKYFEFEFQDVILRKLTYDDGTSCNDPKEDALIGKKILLKTLLVDTAPHLQRGRMFAGDIRIMDFFIGKMELAAQSDVFITIRNNDNDNNGSIYSAYFESNLYDGYQLDNEFLSRENSRGLRESDIRNFKIYMNVCNFNPKLEGEVYGYIGPQINEQNININHIRIQGRRLLIDPQIPAKVRNTLKVDESQSNDIFRNDYEGTYEILEDKRLLILRYMNFIPFSNTNHTPLGDYQYFVVLLNKDETATHSINIKTDYASILESGGVCIFPIPENITDVGDLRLSVMVCENTDLQPFMREPDHDIMLVNNEKFIVLESGKLVELKCVVYENNRLCIKDIEIKLEYHENDDSPNVVSWTSTRGRCINGIVTCSIQARNLENSEEVKDPVSGYDNGNGKNADKQKIRGTISGDLPWDRYYGNYVSLTIDPTSKPIIRLVLPVRVLHSVQLEKLKPSIEQLDKEMIEQTATKLLSYYSRYYPWLHAKYTYTDQRLPKLVYSQFLKIKEYLRFLENSGDFMDNSDLDHWDLVYDAVSRINHLLDRLNKDDSDWGKMPRSRDFPYNGIQFLKMWKISILKNVIKSVKSQQAEIIKEWGSKISIPDLDKWGEVQELMSKIDKTMEDLPETKKLFVIWKLQLFDHMTEHLTIAETSTEHMHGHH
jgi:hypothetical protein